MYRDLKKNDWMKEFNIQEEEIPEGLILYGIMDVSKGVEKFEKHTGIKPDLWLKHNIFRFSHKGKKVALAITYGSPMTSEFVHIFSLLGTKIILQIGSFGGLHAQMQVGDILIPSNAVRMDGASDWYLDKNIAAKPESDIAKWLHAECHLRHVRHRVGTILTTTAMLAETPLIIQSWSDNDYFGVDLETATTLGVAQSFGTARGAILYLDDHIIKGRTHLDESEEEKRFKETGRAHMFHIALDAIAHFT